VQICIHLSTEAVLLKSQVLLFAVVSPRSPSSQLISRLGSRHPPPTTHLPPPPTAPSCSATHTISSSGAGSPPTTRLITWCRCSLSVTLAQLDDPASADREQRHHRVIDTSVAHAARVWNYWLVGKDTIPSTGNSATPYKR